MNERDRDPIARLYDVADDDEANILESLRVRAGLLWRCSSPDCGGWVTPEDETKCGSCGQRRLRAVMVEANPEDEDAALAVVAVDDEGNEISVFLQDDEPTERGSYQADIADPGTGEIVTVLYDPRKVTRV